MRDYNVDQVLGVKGDLREGVIKYREDGKIVKYRSLYVPGVGWCPILKELSEKYTTSAEKLAVFCPEHTANNGSIKSFVSLKSSLFLMDLEDDSLNFSCDRFDIFCHKFNINNTIVFNYCRIRNEKDCEHVTPHEDFYLYEYFINIKLCGKDYRIFASKDILEKIQSNGFLNVRIKFKNGIFELVYPEDNKVEQYKIYDELLIRINDYSVKPLIYGGTEPFYFMEDEKWLSQDKRYLIKSNNVVSDEGVEDEDEDGDNFGEYDNEEEEVEALVAFFKGKGFSRSSQISNYIVEHELGKKFKHISGYLELSNGEEIWEFEGGISPRYYAQICDRLDLGNEGSDSHVAGFSSFAERDNLF